MYGHMKTNKACPVYVGDDEFDVDEKRSMLVEGSSTALGLKVTLNPKRKRGEKERKRDRDDDDFY
jgi:hypothetical protein